MDEGMMRTYLRAEPVFERGHGVLLYDRDGVEYLDFLGGIAVSALGHGHPELTAALRDQVAKVLHVSNLYRHPYTERVATLLTELTGLHAAFFTNSGAEANEAALKIARKHQRLQGSPERTGFVALRGGFHGRTLGALSVTAEAKYREPFEPLIPGVTFVPAGDAGALEKALASRPAALVLEPIQGEGGILELPLDYLRAARRLCTETGTVLIHDEIQCGSGRTGAFLAGDRADVKPDLATLAKPLAAGLPMGACVAAEPLANVLQPGDHGSTFAGGPLVCRAAQLFLELLARGGLLEAVRARGARFRTGLESLAREFPVVAEVRGRGLMLALRLHRGAPELQKTLFRDRLIANCTAGDVVRFLPAYVVTDEQIDEALSRIRAALSTIPTEN